VGLVDRMAENAPAITDGTPPFADLFFAACLDAAKNEGQRLIVTRRYGLDGDGSLTLAAVAASLDRPVSRERVRQILDDILIRIKSRGTRQRRGGQADRPCAALVRHAERVAGSHASGWQAAWGRLNSERSPIPAKEAMVLLIYFAVPHRNRRQAQAAVESFLRQPHEDA
jgi:hypothetical protein